VILGGSAMSDASFVRANQTAAEAALAGVAALDLSIAESGDQTCFTAHSDFNKSVTRCALRNNAWVACTR